MSIYDYRSFIHRFSFLKSHEDSQLELQNRISKNNNNYSREEERLIHDWAIWSAEYGLAVGFDEEDIISLVAPLMKSINTVGNPDEFIRDIQDSKKRAPLLTAPILIPYLHLAAVRLLKTSFGFDDHCQRIFYSMVIHNAFISRDTNEESWFGYEHKGLKLFGNFGKDVDTVRRYLSEIENSRFCRLRKRTTVSLGGQRKTFYFCRIDNTELVNGLSEENKLDCEKLLEPQRKRSFLPDYVKEVNRAASDHFKHQPIPEGYIPHPDNPFLYLGKDGIKVHPEMANYDCVIGTLDPKDHFRSSYYRRKCRHIGQKKILYYSKLIEYLQLGNTNSY